MALLLVVLLILVAVWAWPRAKAEDVLPENDADVRRRINEREVLGSIARRQLADLNVTGSPINRRAS